MITLYHADTAVCAAKVRVVLAEKSIPFEGRLIDLGKGEQFSPDYMKLNPNAVVPTLVHDDEVITESTVICEYLDEVFEAAPLRPRGALGHARVHGWTKREDTIHDAINTVTVAILFRGELLLRAPEERAKRYERIPDPARREKWRTIVEQGLDARYAGEALTRFARLFGDMELALARGPWLVGDRFSLADSGLVSFFFRLEMLGMASCWTEGFPAVADWFARCKARPSFDTAIGRFIGPEKHAHYARFAGPLQGQVEAAFAKALSA
jgi:glutathione S-transferase